MTNDLQTAIPTVQKIGRAFVKNAMDRPAVRWEIADPSKFSSGRRIAVRTIVSSLLAGELAGRAIYANLCVRVPYPDIADAYGAQILDESHHARLFARYLTEKLGVQPVRPILSARYAMAHLARLRDPLIGTTTASLFVECTAAKLLKALTVRIDEPCLAQLLGVVLKDEHRHQALGREASRFLLTEAAGVARMRRIRARWFQRFAERFLYFLYTSYDREARLFDLDIRSVCDAAVAEVRDEVRL